MIRKLGSFRCFAIDPPNAHSPKRPQANSRIFRRVEQAGGSGCAWRMDMRIDPLAEFKKWQGYDTRLIFTNCGAFTWYLRKAWLLDNAPELMPISQPGESFEIRRTIKGRLAKSEYYTHVWIRSRLAFAERLFSLRRSVHQPGSGAGLCWGGEDSWSEPGPPEDRTSLLTQFPLPGKPRALNLADVGHQWIYLKWKWPDSAATRFGYRLERSRSRTSGYRPIATTHGCDLVVLSVPSATKYFYRVRAFNPAGDGPASESLMVTAF